MPTDPTLAPTDLDRSARALYYKLRKYLREFGRWHDSDREMLAQACRWSQRARIARAGMVDEDGRPTLVAEGYKGQLVQHPNLKTADAAEKSYVDALKELGFTPSARVRLNIDAVSTSSEDGDELGGVL